MLVQAHRGVSTEYPENTMPAFAASYEQGYPIIEFDPLFTADGECVVIHDKTVNRTCRNADGSEIGEPVGVAELTLAQLQALDAGIFMGEQFRGTKVPLLREVLAFAGEKGLQVKIDNRFADFPQWQQDKLFAIVKESGIHPGFTCKNPEITRKVLEWFPDATIHYDGYVDEETVLQIKSLLKGNRFVIWLPMPSKLTSWVKVPLATPELCAMVKKYGELGLWILETGEQAAQAAVLGADIIETTGSIKPADCI